MRKEFELESHFPTGEPTIQVVMSVGRMGQPMLEKRAFDRSATSPALEFLKSVRPEPGNSIILVNAMGAFELYDDNRNGDSFPNRPVGVGRKVTCGHASCQYAAWLDESEVLSKHYKSFLKAHFFEHHKNKDPEKAFGNVMAAFWNERMQRVELLLRLFESKNKKLAERIHAGEYPAVSMGCRVKYDVCNICGHRAPTRADYCVHAREKLRQILENGEKCCVHNPSPDFFDISAVFRPADPQGYMLKKVAHHAIWEGWSAKLGEELDIHDAKLAVALKLSDIQKAILGQITKVKVPDPVSGFRSVAKREALARAPKSDADIAKLATLPLNKLASTMASQNLALTASDVARIFLKQSEASLPEAGLDLVVGLQPVFSELFAREPDLAEKIGELVTLDDAYVGGTKEAGAWEMLLSAADPMGLAGGYSARMAPKTDTLTLTDMNTGHQYQTTRGAAQAAALSNKKHELIGSALLASAYSLGLNHIGVTKKLPGWFKYPAAFVAGNATYNLGQRIARPNRNPEYLTDQGIRVPGNTEFTKASAVSALTPTVALTKMAADFYERTGDVADPVSALSRKIAATLPGTKIAVFFSWPTSAQVDYIQKVAETHGEFTPEVLVSVISDLLS